MKRIRVVSIILILVLALGLTVWARAETVALEKKAPTLKVSPSSLTLAPAGAQQTKQLRVTNASAPGQVTWTISSSSVQDVVRIAPNGETCAVTGLRDGTAYIRATDSVKNLSKTVKVLVKTTALKRIVMKGAVNVDPRVGQYQMAYSLEPARTTYTRVLWSVSDIKRGTTPASYGITIDANGVLHIPDTVPRDQTIVVYATAISEAYPTRVADCKITLKPVYATKLKLNTKKATIWNYFDDSKDQSLTLRAIMTPDRATVGMNDVVWTSANPAIATVDNNGVVRPVGEGIVKITASAVMETGGTLSAVCNVNVRAVRVSALSYDSDYIRLEPGDKATLTPTIKPANATFQTFIWTSSDENVATVDANGVVTAVKKGECVITARAKDGGNKNVDCTVRVRRIADMVKITLSGAGDAVLGGNANKLNANTTGRFKELLKDAQGNLDFSRTFKLVQPIFAKDDLTLCNLECVLKSSRSSMVADKKYNFIGEPQYAQILSMGSIEMVSVVNNHSRDFGTSGYNNTRANLTKYGIAYADDFARTYTIEKNGHSIDVGVVAIQTPYSLSGIASRVRAAKAKNDFVIVFYHFGDSKEQSSSVRGTMAGSCRRAIDAGADLVMGCHAHVASGIQVYKGKYIYYGLGALVSPGPNFASLGVLFQQEYYVDLDNGYSEPCIPTLYPTSPTSGETTIGARKATAKNNCQTLPLAKADSRYAKVQKMVRNNSRTPDIDQFIRWGEPA